jgi:hypothetical protein
MTFASCARTAEYTVAPVTTTINPFDGYWRGSDNQRYIVIEGLKGYIEFTNGIRLELNIRYDGPSTAVAFETNWAIYYIAAKAVNIPGRKTWFELRLSGDDIIEGSRFGVWRVQWTQTRLSYDRVDYRIVGVHTNLTHDVYWTRLDEDEIMTN